MSKKCNTCGCKSIFGGSNRTPYKKKKTKKTKQKLNIRNNSKTPFNQFSERLQNTSSKLKNQLIYVLFLILTSGGLPLLLAMSEAQSNGTDISGTGDGYTDFMLKRIHPDPSVNYFKSNQNKNTGVYPYSYTGMNDSKIYFNLYSMLIHVLKKIAPKLYNVNPQGINRRSKKKLKRK